MVLQYRLAVGEHEGQTSVFVEYRGTHYPLAAILAGDNSDALAAARDLMPLMQDWPRLRAMLPARLASHLATSPSGVDARHIRFRPPLANPGKLVCIGTNYYDHIAEMKVPTAPTYPYAFLKPAGNTLRGSGDSVAMPTIATMIDWEAELAVVIGRSAKDVPAAAALEYVAGYANFNDLSARDWIASRPGVGMDWIRHKAFDGFGPFGPYLVPAEFVPDPQNLPMRTSVNGVVKQSSNTDQMIFGVAAIIEHLSAIMTLEPGDVVATGTPAGVGFGQEPQEFLRAGDVIQVEIGELGTLETSMI